MFGRFLNDFLDTKVLHIESWNHVTFVVYFRCFRGFDQISLEYQINEITENFDLVFESSRSL